MNHKAYDFEKLHGDVVFGGSNRKVIWQPRILCWYDDRMNRKEPLPAPYTGMSLPELYRALDCSNRCYDFVDCIEKVYDERVHISTAHTGELEETQTIETPVGVLTSVIRSNTSNGGTYASKWLISSEEDMKVFIWLEESSSWRFLPDVYARLCVEWRGLGLPTLFMPRFNIQSLFFDTMGVSEAVYAMMDYPDTVDAYCKARNESAMRYIACLGSTPIRVVNFGDNLHCKILSVDWFKKYLLPAYQQACDELHKMNFFVSSHWDGDVKTLLPYARETGLDGIEAITPKPQGDVTLKEVKAALGDDLFLLDGIAAILFDKYYPIKTLLEQAQECLELFAPKLVLGISDEMSSTGEIDRLCRVGELVNNFNAKHF